MKYTEFKNYIKGKPDRSVFLLEGEDAFFRSRALDAVKDKIAEPSLNYAFFDYSDCNIKDVVSSLDSYPFMSDYRLTVIRDFYPQKDVLKGELGRYLSNPPRDSLLVIVNEKVSEPLKKIPCVLAVDCGKADKSIICKWIVGECALNGVSIDSDAADSVAEYCLLDMARIEGETRKLIAYAGKGGNVGIDVVNALVSRESEYKIYEMTDYIGKRKFDDAFTVIEELLSKGETPQRLIVSVYNYFRRLLHVAISDKSPAENAALLGIKEFAVKKTSEQSKLFKKRALKKAVDVLSDADYNLKCGNAEIKTAFWLTIFKIMTEA